LKDSALFGEGGGEKVNCEVGEFCFSTNMQVEIEPNMYKSYLKGTYEIEIKSQV
jgi:hypothetical protein